MKTLTNPLVTTVFKNALVTVMALLPGLCGAQTILSGNISGTWSPSGNPYVIPDNVTVQEGQTLTIQPGVIVWIGEGVSINVNGGIQAVGTPQQRITFQPPINSQYWNTISVNNSGTNIFSYCDFVNAATALGIGGTSTKQISHCTFQNVINALVIGGGSTNQISHCKFQSVVNTALTFQEQSGNEVSFSTFLNVSNGVAMNPGGRTLQANILNSSFSNCSGKAVSGTADAGCSWAGTIISSIKNCSFNAVSCGCSFYIKDSWNCGLASSRAEVQIIGNMFQNVTNTAVSLTAGGGQGSSATLINNIVVNASNGVNFQDPWDAKMQDSILVGCTNAVSVNGGLSRSVSCNDFYGNATNFVGYPSTYGNVIIANRNGTPCDLLYNIFQNPKFKAADDYDLQSNSPCIDAGTPDAACMDLSFPPSQGTGLPDLGIYGGPLAVNWLAVIPETPAPITLSATKAIRLACTDVLTRGSYQILSSSDLTTWTDYGAPFYMTNTSNFVKYVDATNEANYFRLQCLP